MYITISRKPSKEEIAKFNMKISEDDSITDYRIDLAALGQEAKSALCESYALSPERIKDHASVTFSYIHVV